MGPRGAVGRTSRAAGAIDVCLHRELAIANRDRVGGGTLVAVAHHLREPPLDSRRCSVWTMHESSGRWTHCETSIEGFGKGRKTWCALGEMQGRGKAQGRGRRIAVRTATRICTTSGAEIAMTRGYSHTATRHMAACITVIRKSRVVFSRFARACRCSTTTLQHAPIRHKPHSWHDSTGTEYNLTRGS